MLAVAAGCARGSGRGPRLIWANQPGYGEVATCPDGAVDTSANRGEGPSPMQGRCSYSDAAGAITQLGGYVRVEDEVEHLARPLADAQLQIFRLGKGGRRGSALARTRTTPQGGFSVSARLPPGSYLIAVRKGGKLLAERTLTLTGQGARRLENLEILVPATLVPAED